MPANTASWNIFSSSRKNRKVPVPAQTSESKAMLSEQDLWGDAPQLQLHCLIEGESSIITIEVPGNMIISFVKDFIHEKDINTVRTIPSKDLSLLKVDIDLGPHNRHCLNKIAYKEGDEGTEPLGEWEIISSFWPHQPPLDRLHIFVQLPFHDSLLPRPPLNVSPRNGTVSGLYQRLKQYGFIQVCGTPASGKTVLAELLAQHITRHSPEVDVIWINGWPLEEVRIAGGAYLYLERKGWEPYKKTVFIFDDAHMSYMCRELWNDFFKTIHAYENRRAIAFTSFGSPMLWVFEQGTPLEWCAAQTVLLRPVRHNDYLPPVGLLFSRGEFDDLIARSYPNPKYYFDSSFFDSVFSLTGGHVGAVLGFITAITSHDSYCELKYSGQLYTWDTFSEKVSLPDLFERLSTSAVQKGLPNDKDLQTLSIAHIFSTVLDQGIVIKDDFTSEDDQHALQHCFLNGWLQAHTLCEIGPPEVVTFGFASPLHRWFVEWKLYSESSAIQSKFTGLSI